MNQNKFSKRANQSVRDISVNTVERSTFYLDINEMKIFGTFINNHHVYAR